MYKYVMGWDNRVLFAVVVLPREWVEEVTIQSMSECWGDVAKRERERGLHCRATSLGKWKYNHDVSL